MNVNFSLFQLNCRVFHHQLQPAVFDRSSGGVSKVAFAGGMFLNDRLHFHLRDTSVSRELELLEGTNSWKEGSRWVCNDPPFRVARHVETWGME